VCNPLGCAPVGVGMIERGVVLVALLRWQRGEVLKEVNPMSLTANVERLGDYAVPELCPGRGRDCVRGAWSW
jgi:hypothetical protein